MNKLEIVAPFLFPVAIAAPIALAFLAPVPACDNPTPPAAADDGPWCCAAPRRWCHKRLVCIEHGPDGCCNVYDEQEPCADLCDKWERYAPAPNSTVCPPR